MIKAAHTLIYSDDPEATRAFLRDVVRWPFVEDARSGSGWLNPCSTIPRWFFSTSQPPASTRWGAVWCGMSSTSCGRRAHVSS